MTVVGDPSRLMPTSFGQRQLWLTEELIGPSRVHLIPTLLRVRGELDLSALDAALVQLVARHDVLRSRFVPEDESDVMRVVDQPPATVLTIEDLTALPIVERLETARRFATRVAQRPIDLERGPIYESWAFRIASDDHLILFIRSSGTDRHSPSSAAS